MSRMVRKQIYLTADLQRRLRDAARAQKRPEAEVLREALDRHLSGSSLARDLGADPLWGIVGAGRSGKRDTSRHVDDYLYGSRRR